MVEYNEIEKDLGGIIVNRGAQIILLKQSNWKQVNKSDN